MCNELIELSYVDGMKSNIYWDNGHHQKEALDIYRNNCDIGHMNALFKYQNERLMLVYIKAYWSSLFRIIP